MRARFLRPSCFVFCLAFVAACSGGGSPGDTDDVVVGVPGTIPTPPQPNPTPQPTPTPTPAVEFDARFIDLGKPGAYPSDLVIDRNGSLYTVDDAQIPAHLLRYPASGGDQPTPRVAITATHLIDSDGARPANTPTLVDYGEGLFGAFTGDLEVVEDRWVFATVSAGSSVSAPGGSPLRLANVVLIDAEQGGVVQTINLAWPKLWSGNYSNSGPYTVIPQSLPSQVAFVPNPDAPGTGRLFVACSNGAGDSNGISLWYQGTIQVWRVDFSKSQPITPDTTARAPTDVTRTFVSQYYNPVGLTHYQSAVGVNYLVLTDAGASRFDENYVAHPESDAMLEFLDLGTEQWRTNYEVNLGKILPSVQKIALGKDSLDRSFGAIASQTFAAAYLVDFSGLDSNPVNPADVRLLRTIETAEGGSQTVGSGFHPAIAMTPSSRTLVLSTFAPASLVVVGLPGDIEFGAIAVNPAPFAGADLTAELSAGMGSLAIAPGNDRDVYVLTNGTLDFGSYLPKDPAYVATLTVRDRLP